MKSFLFAIIAASATAGASSHVFAQQWDPWGGPRRPPVQVMPDDDSGADTQDDRYFNERGYDNREGPRVDNRQNYRDDDPRRYDPRYNGDPDYGGGDRDGPRYDDQRYSEPSPAGRAYFNDRRAPDSRYFDDRDDYGAWDAAPSPDDEARLSKTPGTTGGDRPDIRPVAPAQVAFSGPYSPGSIVIDTGARKLYYVLSSTSAYEYSIGVGRQGFTWTGKEKVSRVADWPDWYPPADMRRRKPELPERMLGGIRNPLGVKAIYLGNTLYRIHGTNDPKSIGKAESSGCFRMLNENVLHLASLVRPGTEVTVVRSLSGKIAANAKAKAASPPRSYARGANVPMDDYDPYNGWH